MAEGGSSTSCTAGVAACMLNAMERENPGSTGREFWNRGDVEREFGDTSIENGSRSAQNSHEYVATATQGTYAPSSVATSGTVTSFSQVLAARRPGKYQLFFGETRSGSLQASHTVYAEINAGGDLNIVDLNVGVSWSDWNSFLSYARKNPSLYGSSPEFTHATARFIPQ
jgi:hypothetical protein